jgi:hypothetical protein
MTNCRFTPDNWSNSNTFEAFNLLASFEDIYELVKCDQSVRTLVHMLIEAMHRHKLPPNHIDLLAINYEELASFLKELGK